MFIIWPMPAPGTSRLAQFRQLGDEPHLLREVVRTYQVLMTGFSRKTGIPSAQFMLLRLLAVSDGDLGVMDLARRLGVNASAVTRQVQALERDRIVLRRVDRRDARRNYVSLSLKGKRLFERIRERHHEIERMLSKVLTAEEMCSATVVLGKLRAFVEGLR